MNLKIVSRISLRVLLVGGFLFCALLTGFSGGAGIWSLGQIKATMNDTADDVIKNVDNQNTRIQQLIPVRKTIARVFKSSTEDELDSILSDLSEFKKG